MANRDHSSEEELDDEDLEEDSDDGGGPTVTQHDARTIRDPNLRALLQAQVPTPTSQATNQELREVSFVL